MHKKKGKEGLGGSYQLTDSQIRMAVIDERRRPTSGPLSFPSLSISLSFSLTVAKKGGAGDAPFLPFFGYGQTTMEAASSSSETLFPLYYLLSGWFGLSEDK